MKNYDLVSYWKLRYRTFLKKIELVHYCKKIDLVHFVNDLLFQGHEWFYSVWKCILYFRYNLYILTLRYSSLDIIYHFISKCHIELYYVHVERLNNPIVFFFWNMIQGGGDCYQMGQIWDFRDRFQNILASWNFDTIFNSFWLQDHCEVIVK